MSGFKNMNEYKNCLYCMLFFMGPYIKQEPLQTGATLDFYIIKYGFDNGQGHIMVMATLGRNKMLVLCFVHVSIKFVHF